MHIEERDMRCRVLTLWVALQPERPPQDTCKPVDSNELCKCSHSDAPRAEAELLPQVRNLVQDSKRVALTAPPYAGHSDQSAERQRGIHQSQQRGDIIIRIEMKKNFHKPARRYCTQDRDEFSA